VGAGTERGDGRPWRLRKTLLNSSGEENRLCAGKSVILRVIC